MVVKQIECNYKMIRVSKDIHKLLETLKTHVRETFNDVITRLIIDND